MRLHPAKSKPAQTNAYGAGEISRQIHRQLST